MHVVVAGSSGFLGQALLARLRSAGHEVTRLVRRSEAAADASRWDPYAGQVDTALVQGADVVVNLAGSPTFGNPHSRKWSDELLRSRVMTTALLARTIAEADAPPAFLAGNGISYYGDHGDVGDPVLDESAVSRGDALLTRVTREWQAAADPAVDAGARVCFLRTSPVIDGASPPLSLMKPLFKLGGAARLGRGDQHFPIISLRDWTGAVVHLAEDADVSGPVNLCCVDVPTNAEFTDALAGALHRPSPRFLKVPAPLIRVAAGRMAPEVLGSVRARPAALLGAGYAFQDPDVHAVVTTALTTR